MTTQKTISKYYGPEINEELRKIQSLKDDIFLLFPILAVEASQERINEVLSTLIDIDLDEPDYFIKHRVLGLYPILYRVIQDKLGNLNLIVKQK